MAFFRLKRLEGSIRPSHNFSNFCFLDTEIGLKHITLLLQHSIVTLYADISNFPGGPPKLSAILMNFHKIFQKDQGQGNLLG